MDDDWVELWASTDDSDTIYHDWTGDHWAHLQLHRGAERHSIRAVGGVGTSISRSWTVLVGQWWLMYSQNRGLQLPGLCDW